MLTAFLVMFLTSVDTALAGTGYSGAVQLRQTVEDVLSEGAEEEIYTKEEEAYQVISELDGIERIELTRKLQYKEDKTEEEQLIFDAIRLRNKQAIYSGIFIVVALTGVAYVTFKRK